MLILFITPDCSFDLSLGSPCFMRPNYASSFSSFSTSSKAISSLYMILKICSGPSKAIEFVWEVLPLKIFV